MKYLGQDKDINLKTKKPEFLDWKWVDLARISELVVNFKLEVYQKVQQKVKNILVNSS
jgi:putative (di)nucleoside polyphosphate hydrolase